MKLLRLEILAKPFCFGKAVTYQRKVATCLFVLMTVFNNLSYAACEDEEDHLVRVSNLVCTADKTCASLAITKANAVTQKNTILVGFPGESESNIRQQIGLLETDIARMIRANSPYDRITIVSRKLMLCAYKEKLNKFTSSDKNQTQQQSNQGQPSFQQNQAAQQPSTQQQSQQAQQQAQQTQQLAAQNQARADQARQGKRKTHDPAAEAHECISIDPDPGLFGAFKNTCSYKVNFNTCNYKPRVRSGGFNWSADFDCEQQKFGLHTPDGGRAVASHNRNTEMVYWFACKAPAFPVDGEFTVGRGIQARCN